MRDYLAQANESFQNQGGQKPGLLRGLWLKNSGKLLRFLQRRYAYASAQQGFANRIVFSGSRSRWQLKKH